MRKHTNEPSHRHPSFRSVLLVLMAATASLGAVTTASAQAWIPAKDSGVFELTYARATSDRHYFQSEPLDAGNEYSNIGIIGVDYALTDRLAVRSSLSYVASKYSGPPDFQEGELDNGIYHGTLTDFVLEARYVAVEKGNFVLTPFLGFIIPTHDYESEGHAAPSRGLTQVPIGVGLGYTWPRPVHTTFLQARFAYSYLETDGYDFGRTNAFVEGGVFLAKWCSIRGLVGGEQTHGGIDWIDIDTSEEFETHDARTASEYWSAALGLTFIVSRSVSLSASYSELVGGNNIVNTHTLWGSMSWYFGGAGSKLIGKSR